MTKKIFLIIIAPFLSVQYSFCQFGSQNIIETTVNKVTDISTADLNNDNLMDIIVSKHFNPFSVSYFLNQGNGTFGSEQAIDSNLQKPISIASGDFDNNGWVDIVVADYVLNKVVLYKNNLGIFTTHLLDSSLFLATEVKVADIDLDNDLDIIAIGDIELVVYYNDGSGSFSKQIIPQGGSPTEYYALELGDIDGDGFIDVLIGGTTIRVYKNVAGTISFDSIRTDTIPDNNNLSFFVGLADFDNDGDIDLLADGNPNIIRWLKNDGNGHFTNPQIVESNAASGSSISISLNDFDNNGGVDIFTISSSLELVWFANDSIGNFSSSNFILSTNSWVTDVFSSDLNNDNLTDIIWSSGLSFHLNNSVLNVSEQEYFNFSLYPNPASNKIYIKTKSSGILTIFNIKGQLIYPDIELTEGDNIIDLDLKPQVYFLVFKSENRLIQRKLIIN